jgi:hypothetical protein
MHAPTPDRRAVIEKTLNERLAYTSNPKAWHVTLAAIDNFYFYAERLS